MVNTIIGDLLYCIRYEKGREREIEREIERERGRDKTRATILQRQQEK